MNKGPVLTVLLAIHSGVHTVRFYSLSASWQPSCQAGLGQGGKGLALNGLCSVASVHSSPHSKSHVCNRSHCPTLSCRFVYFTAVSETYSALLLSVSQRLQWYRVLSDAWPVLRHVLLFAQTKLRAASCLQHTHTHKNTHRLALAQCACRASKAAAPSARTCQQMAARQSCCCLTAA